jgi:hypothetical protein
LQFLAIDLALTADTPELQYFEDLTNYIQHRFAYKFLFPNWDIRGLFIVFMEHRQRMTWRELEVGKDNEGAGTMILL